MADIGNDNLVQRVNGRVFYGWIVLAVAALGIFASGPGQSHTFSVFVGPIGADLGLTATEIAAAYGFATLVAAFCLPQMGKLVDRHGAKRMLTVVAGLLGLCCIAFGAAAGMIWLAIGFAGLRFLGQGSLMLGCANMVSQWFDKKRGFALSLMVLGFSASMAVHPPLSQWLIDTVGWRQGWLWLGFSTWLLLLPAFILFARNRPEDFALRPDGAAPASSDSPEADASVQQSATDLTLREALRTPAFYIIAVCMFSLSMLVTSLHFFQISILTDHGLDAGLAAKAFPVSAFVMVLAMPLVGKALDNLRTELVFCTGLIVMALALVSASMVSDFTSAMVYAAIFGLNNATTMTFFGFMWPHYFGRAHLGSIQGAGQMIGVIGASLGPLPLGIAQDLFGSYDPMLLAMASVPACGAVAVLFLRKPAKPLPA
jgi:MFS family permease